MVRFELDYYLDFVETNRPQRFEYRDGHIFPIEAATPDHAAIEANLSAAVIPQLKRADCVEHWTRKKSGRWSMTLYESLDDVVRIKSLNIAISLADVYAGIEVGVD